MSLRSLCHFAAALFTLTLAVPACDELPADAEADALPCNLADEACAARPGAADAVAVLAAMGLYADAVDVELVEDPHLVSGIDPADAPAGPDALADDVDPVGRSSCNGSGATFCCCYWDGPWWGCACTD